MIDAYVARYALSADEAERLRRVAAEWPPDLVPQGIYEEVADIYAARELATRPPLTIEDARAIRRALVERGELI